MKPADVVVILKSEYGIETQEQLQEAIRKLGFIDISPFCAEISNVKERAS